MLVDFLKHAYILLSHGPVISTMQKIWTQSGNLIINVDAIYKNRGFLPFFFSQHLLQVNKTKNMPLCFSYTHTFWSSKRDSSLHQTHLPSARVSELHVENIVCDCVVLRTVQYVQ